ncbi:hypothetical protein GCM10011579_097220 [Streptomyces albiflavescens]|uniref:Uncharacterized protein n=1 Tax=Streptomyces albiflavescens TaxID=1623582 RepID=A0A917YH99_9ACTN|nr:hypothetical protein [Streptomyces albiflavescens]GGN96127.1 hypothetical protein GCM10011579_097220 [Streptomyces albiflavescens]
MNRPTADSHGEWPRQRPGHDDVEPEDDGPYADVADPATGTVWLCAHRCGTCIFHPGNPMYLQPGRVADMVSHARRAEGHVVCHKTLGTDAPAICRGFADGPDQGRSFALRLARALGTLTEISPP